MKPKLFQYEACPFCHKVRALLKYKGVDYEKIEVHPLNKKEISFSENYRRVPIYIDTEGNQVNDSNVIMRRIDEEFPARKVFQKNASQAEKEEQWLAWSEIFVKGLPVAIYDTLSNSLQSFDYITKIGKFSWFQKVMIKYSGAFVMTMVAKKIKEREGIENPKSFLKKVAEEWSQGLQEQDFMGGESPGAADIAVFGVANSVRDLSAFETLTGNTLFRNWFERVEESMKAPIQVAS